jgi:hypothetical protein
MSDCAHNPEVARSQVQILPPPTRCGAQVRGAGAAARIPSAGTLRLWESERLLRSMTCQVSDCSVRSSYGKEDMPRRNRAERPRRPGRGRPARPMFGDVLPRIDEAAQALRRGRSHRRRCTRGIPTADFLAIPCRAGMNMWEGPDLSGSRRVVIGIMHEGTTEAVIYHANDKKSQRHGKAPGGGDQDG